MRAFGRGESDSADAVRAILCCRFFFRLFSLQFIDASAGQEHGKGDNKKTNDSVNKQPVTDSHCSSFLGNCQGGIEGLL